MSDRYLLLLDTSRAEARVGLAHGSEVVSERTWQCAVRQDPDVLMVVAEVLAEAGIAVDQLARVAVQRGPGHYSLLRSGIVTAMVLAEAAGCELVAVGTGSLADQITEAVAAEPVAVIAPQYE